MPHQFSKLDATLSKWVQQLEADQPVQQRMLRVNARNVVVALSAVVLTTLLSLWGLKIQNDGLRLQNELLTQQLESTKQQAESLRIQSSALAAGASRDLDIQNAEILKLLFDRPHLRAFFYDDVDIRLARNAEDRARILLLAEMFLDFMESFVNPHVSDLPNMKSGEAYRTAWDNYFIALFKKSPILCQRLKATREWYTNPSFEDYAAKGCSSSGVGTSGR